MIYATGEGPKTVVFWDAEDCPIPDDLNAVTTVNNIETALWDKGYQGKFEITAFADLYARTCQFQGTCGSKLFLNHGPAGNKNERRSIILVQFLIEAIRADYGTNFVLILGDILKHSGFIRAIRHLKTRYGKRVVLVQPQIASLKELCGNLSSGWLWAKLSAGQKPVRRLTRTKGLKFIEEDEYTTDCDITANTAIFWDMMGCPIPAGFLAAEVSLNIKSALAKHGTISITDFVPIFAYGDTNKTQGFKHYGIVPKHLPAGGDEDARLEKILVDLLCYLIDHPDTTNVMLILGHISGHVEFLYAINFLLNKKFELLLAQPQNTSEPQCHVGTTKWLWSTLSTDGGPPFCQSDC